MSHLALLETLPGGEDPATWLEPVTDEQYQQANKHQLPLSVQEEGSSPCVELFSTRRRRPGRGP
jgi:hypothetical protein